MSNLNYLDVIVKGRGRENRYLGIDRIHDCKQCTGGHALLNGKRAFFK